MSRTDVHAPSNFNPQHYSYVGLVYIGPIGDEMMYDPSDDEALAFIREHKGVGVYGLGQCDHCGARHIYCHIFHYEGPGTHGWVSVGNDCAQGRFQLPDRATFELATMRRKVAEMREYGKKSAAVRQVMAENPGLAEAVEWVREARAHLRDLADAKQQIIDRGDENTPAYAQACREHNTAARMIGWNINTIEDITSKLFRFGGISEKQVAFVAKLAAEGAEKQANAKRVAEQVAAMEPLKAGRATVRGVIKSAKIVDSDYGTTLKLAISLPSGHTVYGTCPQALGEALNACSPMNSGVVETSDYRGAEVTLAMTIDPKVGDNDFAIYKRPTFVELHNAAAIRERLVEREIAKAEARLADYEKQAAQSAVNNAGWGRTNDDDYYQRMITLARATVEELRVELRAKLSA
jgi:hypothetical protein